MAMFRMTWGTQVLLMAAVILLVMPNGAAAFGAGNIPSIAQVEGHNWRHGDIEDILETIAFLHGKKWTARLIKRCYFGNWLRDYSQAVDVGSLKSVNAATIRILVWVLSFLSFGYATEEFEVTEERLGVYRPEEHIDNPLGYADGADARKFDPRLRGPVMPGETDIDMRTGMKNYIANETTGFATSAGYLRFSFARCIHFGRVYTSGAQGRGREDDLCEALRCLGQALHCMEDFSAHSNYCELALRELGYHEVFPHCGAASEINLQGRRVFPLVTGTFGGVDFLHSVLGEATDHFTQSEVDQMNVALQNAQNLTGKKSSESSGPSGAPAGTRGFGGGIGGGGGGGADFISLVAQLPGIGGNFAKQARDLQAISEAQERDNARAYGGDLSRADATNPNVVPGMSPSFDPVKVAKQIYPILEFRDKIVKAISTTISKIPGLEKLLDHIAETLTAFILGLLAPFVRPIINQVSKALKDGSSGVISASAHSQLEPWKNPYCTDPTHSMLSKDHFTNILNPCAGRVAATILQYVVPRVLYAWENPGVPVDEVVNDVLRAFHHPALRNDSIEIQRNMFNTVRKWAEESPHRHQLNQILGSESVKAGKNHILANDKSHAGHGAGAGAAHSHGSFTPQGAWGAMQDLGHGKVKGSLWGQLANRDLASMQGHDGPSVSASTYLPPTSPSPAYGGGPGQPPVSPGYGYHGSGPVGSGYGGPPPPQPAYGQPAYQGYNQPPPTAQNTYWQQPGAGQSQHHGHPPYHHGGGSGYPGAGYHGAGGASAGYYGQQQPPYGGGYGGGY